MHNLVANGFQERQLHLQTMTLPLYLPHHGVSHPCQPGKIRVVFDCSAEIRGISLNKELLPGLYLGQLAEVLIRFTLKK